MLPMVRYVLSDEQLRLIQIHKEEKERKKHVS